MPSAKQVRRVVLPGRCLERPQVRSVDLVALHELDVAEICRDWLDRMQGVNEHPLVGLDQLREARTILVGGIEHVRHVRKIA